MKRPYTSSARWLCGWPDNDRAYAMRRDHSRRLVWAHGEHRAAEIVAGRDVEANADLASWRALGAKP